MESFTPNAATEIQLSSDRRTGTAEAEPQFAPGTMVADRYRIVSLLGSGGMGEVYRADDVKVGQRVALKYVPPRISSEQLYKEVRIGQQISHPNVCRLHDIVETDGQRFISMEYVDGEDLASLLRRIGRLPPDKAVALARDLCAGLAAAHDRGFIHRDLKPANVMIDGRGNARITDFGLAVLQDEEGRDFGGTPLYMSPEQLEHGTATVRSDIYALGLVLFEMFTGRRVFNATSTTDLRAEHSLTKTAPSSVVREIDPAIERLILRCIAEDPGNRPSSVREVMAALPGGDALQAAIAEGKTPSPELVAAAGPAGGLEPWRAWVMLAACLALLVVAAVLREKGNVTSRIADIKSAEALLDDARSLVRSLGYEGKPADQSGRFVGNSEYVEKYSRAHPNARTLPPAAAPFLYRDSPVPLIPRHQFAIVGRDDPPQNVPGMTTVLLDAAGGLREFRRVPPERVTPAAGSFDWAPAFRAAGLDPAELREVVPEWTAPVASDRRYAWSGANVRVEAASAGGKPAWFVVLDPYGAPLKPALGSSAHTLAIVKALVLIAAVVLARRNVRQGSGDRRRAMIVGVLATAMITATVLLTAHHVAVPAPEWNMIVGIASYAMFNGAFSAVCYLAVEPYVRRRWPVMLTAWTRLLAGRWRDPLVGTEVLAGLLYGALGLASSSLVARLLEQSAFVPLTNPLAQVAANHFGGTLGVLLDAISTGTLYAFGWMTLLVFFRRVFRSDRIAWMLVPLAIALTAAGGEQPLVALGIALPSIVSTVLALRFRGTLAAAASIAFYMASNWSPFVLEPGAAFFGRSITVLGFFVLLAIWGFRLSLAGKPVFGSGLVEDEAGA